MIPRRDPKKGRPRSAARTVASGGESKASQSTSAPTPPQPKRPIPTLQEPANPVLRAIHRVRGTELTPLEQLTLLALGQFLHGGERQLGAALVAGLLRIPVGTANNILSTLRRAGFITSDGKFSRRYHTRATRGLTAKGRRVATGGRSSANERQDAHQPVSVNTPRRSSANDTRRSSAREMDQVVGRRGRSHPLRGTTPGKKTKKPAAAAAALEPDGPTFSVADALCPPAAGTGRRTNSRPAEGQA